MSDKLVILRYISIHSESEKTIPLNKEQILEWESCFKNNRNFAVRIGNELRGLNPNHIVEFKIENVNHDLFPLEEPTVAIYPFPKQSTADEKDSNNSVKEDDVPVAEENGHLNNLHKRIIDENYETFKVECKCGANYLPILRKTAKWTLCRECNEQLFVDYRIGKVEHRFGEGWLLTNKYWVDRKYPAPWEDDRLQFPQYDHE